MSSFAQGIREQARLSFENAIAEIKQLEEQATQYTNENLRMEAELKASSERVREKELEMRALHGELAKLQSELRVRDQVLKAHDAVAAGLHDQLRTLNRQVETERAEIQRERTAFAEDADRMAEKALRKWADLDYLNRSTRS